jgi:hypothetical protein
MVYFRETHPAEEEPVFLHTNPLARRIAAGYREMPGLSLTAAQAVRLWSADRAQCAEALHALVASGRLRYTSDRRYCAA